MILFGQFDTARLNNSSLVAIDAQRLAVSKSIEAWQFRIEELQPPGKRRMTAIDFINGWRLPERIIQLG